MKKLLIFLLLILFLFNNETVFATSCVIPKVENSFNNADVVFSGIVKDVKYLENPEKVVEPKIIVTFNVYKTWKGSKDKNIILNTVFNAWSKEGYFFYENNEYLVYAYNKEDGTLGVSLCGGIKALSDAEEDLIKLGDGTIPEINNSAIAPLKNNNSNNIFIYIILIVLLVLILIFISIRRKRI